MTKKFVVVSIPPITPPFYMNASFCLGIDAGNGGEALSDDAIAEEAGIPVETLIDKINEILYTRPGRLRIFQYVVSDNGPERRMTDTYFLYKEDAKQVVEWLNSLEGRNL